MDVNYRNIIVDIQLNVCSTAEGNDKIDQL